MKSRMRLFGSRAVDDDDDIIGTSQVDIAAHLMRRKPGHYTRRRHLKVDIVSFRPPTQGWAPCLITSLSASQTTASTLEARINAVGGVNGFLRWLRREAAGSQQVVESVPCTPPFFACRNLLFSVAVRVLCVVPLQA